MYGLSDQSNGIPCTRFSAERHGSSRYSTRIPVPAIEHTFVIEPCWISRSSSPRDPPADAAAADRPAPRPLLPPAGRRRLDARRHGPRPPMETPWDEILAGRRPGRADLHHAHASGPRRRRRPRAPSDGRAGLQGRLDYAQCERVWGNDDWPERIAEWFLRHGVPPEVAEELIESGTCLPTSSASRGTRRSSTPGDEIDGWRSSRAPGHADGHSCLARGRRADRRRHLLAPITPAIGLYPESRPDPLGDYLESLRASIELAPRDRATPATASRSQTRRPRCARSIEHHRRAARPTPRRRSAAEPRTGYDVSHDLFGRELGRRSSGVSPSPRRSPTSSGSSCSGRAERREDDRDRHLYCALSSGGRAPV